jgi:hypothetical protein
MSNNKHTPIYSIWNELQIMQKSFPETNFTLTYITKSGQKLEYFTRTLVKEKEIKLSKAISSQLKIEPNIKFIHVRFYKTLDDKKQFKERVIDLYPEQKEEKENIIVNKPLQGLGDLDIQRLIQSEVSKIEKEKEFNRLLSENEALKKDLEKQISEYNALVDEFNELEKQKKQFQFNGLDLVELGGQAIQKLIIAKPKLLKGLGFADSTVDNLVNILQEEDESNETKQIEAHDNSFIVDDNNINNENNQPKVVCIETIRKYLYTLPEIDLQKINEILYEIQNKPETLNLLHSCIKK